MSIVRDIAESIEHENEIRRLAAIIENSKDAIIGIDLQGIITSWNKGAESIYCYAKSEAIGSNYTILAPDEKKEEVRSNIERTMKGDEINDFETMRRNKRDEKVYVSLTTSPVKDSGGNIVGVSIIARDITERKEREKELQEKYQELEAAYEELTAAEEQLRQNCRELEDLKEKAECANEAKNRFLANMNHEIRTPINGIMCIAELLSNTELNKQQREYISMLKTSSESLLQIVNDVLDISKIESGKFKLNKEPFNLRGNIEKIIKEFWVISQNKNVELMYFIEPFVNLGLVGDHLRLNQVLINLINNAIKFTERGHILITVSKTAIDSNSIRLLFSVEDTGVGISDEIKIKLFKVFSQGDDSCTKKYGGTGLGLAICKEIVTMMNGEIWVVSREGEGSTFYFTAEFSINNNVHLYSKEGSPLPQLNTNADCNTGSKTILIAEDNPINQKVACAFVLKWGYNCLCASNGKEAIEKLEKENIDLILMDVQMPELDGLQTTKIIREREVSSGRHLPIIAMTAYTMVEDRQKCIDAGMDDYIPKPINVNELYKKIQNYLAG